MLASENGGKSFVFVLRSIALYTARWNGNIDTNMVCIYFALFRSDCETFRYIMPRLYIGKQYCKAYDNNIKGENIGARREERDENNGVSHHFIYKIKVPFICHRYRYIFTGEYSQQHNIFDRTREASYFIGFCFSSCSSASADAKLMPIMRVYVDLERVQKIPQKSR